MLHVNNDTKKISLTRGDTAKIQVSIEIDDEIYTPQDGDVVRFAMKRNFKDQEPVLIIKDIPTDTMVLHIEPSDTKPLAYKKVYVYDIQITFANGDVRTFISGELELLPEVE